ncbi:MAG TPA: C4-dicarboxylate transporter DctA [Gammaproteobacteria bacterium]|jgi:aerobic C4-dicarboxylate transport protein|nr:C4-dicarboxylate transporter DctA [Gammaproteobacteria bacterium]
MKLIKQLYFQVIVSIIIGVLLGHFYPDIAVQMKPLGDAFIKLVRMIVAPIIFVTVVSGIISMKDTKEAGRVGIKAIVYFEVVTTAALLIGLLVANLYQPGAGLNIDTHALNTKLVEGYVSSSSHFDSTHFILNMIPNTLGEAFAKGDILPVLLVAILFGFGMLYSGEKVGAVSALIEHLSVILFTIVGFIMRIAPIGAFGAMAFTIGAYGVGTLASLGKVLACVYLTCFLFIFLVLGSIARLSKFSLWDFLVFIKEEMLIVLGTSSSEAVLPRMIDKLEKFGCGKTVVGLVLPVGYSFNLDGTSIYLTIAALFIAQAFNIDLTLTQQLTLIAVLLLTSKGAAAVAGGGFIVLAATLSAMHTIPVEGLALILGIDRFMSEARSITNLIGNGVATVVIAKWEGDFKAPSVQIRG